MPKIELLIGSSGGFELDLAEYEATPQPLMKLSTHLHAVDCHLWILFLFSISSVVDRSRTTVHNWVRKADLHPEDGKYPTHVALDETVIQLNSERYWLLAAVDPGTNGFLHFRPHLACTIAFTELFLHEHRQKHDIADALFLVNGAP